MSAYRVPHDYSPIHPPVLPLNASVRYEQLSVATSGALQPRLPLRLYRVFTVTSTLPGGLIFSDSPAFPILRRFI